MFRLKCFDNDGFQVFTFINVEKKVKVEVKVKEKTLEESFGERSLVVERTLEYCHWSLVISHL
jgi:hypothetical protein